MLLRALVILISSLSLLASEPGLAVRFSQLPASSAVSAPSTLSIIPFASFHVPSHQAPAFGLAPGPFAAEITGFISVDLRAQHTFTVELTGQTTLLINGKELLNTGASESETNFTSAPIRLSKGTNAVTIRYTSPTKAAATFRLLWSSKATAVPIPIPATALSHDPSPELTRSLSIQNGAFLYKSFQCGNCHAPDQKRTAAFDAPTFAGIGSRLNSEWIASKILDPSADRPSRMPALLHDAQSKESARAIAAYLTTLTSETGPLSASTSPSAGATLVTDLNCRSCHTFPNEAVTSDRISLRHVPKKFRPAAIAAYLQNPQAHYPGNPMPNFKLTRDEAEAITAFLLEGSPANSDSLEPALATAGKDLVQSSGCLNCHTLSLPNKFLVPSSAQLLSTNRGCLAPDPQNAPRFAFTESDRSDLSAFLSSMRGQSTLAVAQLPAQFAARSIDFLRCDQCHTDNNLPAPLALGDKLKPEWAAHFIAGEIPTKPRPWLKARMPAFPAYATNLATGLAAIHGNPPITPAESSPNPDLIKTGETLIGSTGGFSCVACHAVGSSSVQLVVESPGVNLAFSGDRLLTSYFRRWLMNPIAIEPSTKMPAYFDAEGRSQLTEFFEGDAHQQVDAMWHYIRNLSSASSK